MDPYPPVQVTSADTVYRWLKWSVIGLIPAGMGTILFAPVAIVGAVWRPGCGIHLDRAMHGACGRRSFVAPCFGTTALALVFLLALHMS